jgi:deazaflavin-dependent oxidoreductase (nitroreductase family)
MSTSPAEYNAQIIDEFHAHEGRVGGVWEETPMLLLHHTRAKSGKSHVTPLAYLSDGGRHVVIASNGGAPTSPGWYHNIKAHPNVTIEVGSETIDVVARETNGEERERLFRTQAERFPQLFEYEQKTERLIPVIVFDVAVAVTADHHSLYQCSTSRWGSHEPRTERARAAGS